MVQFYQSLGISLCRGSTDPYHSYVRYQSAWMLLEVYKVGIIPISDASMLAWYRDDMGIPISDGYIWMI